MLLRCKDLPLCTVKCCSVVFGVTLRLLVINTSSSSPAINKLRRLPATSVINLPWSIAIECIALNGRSVYSTRWSQILVTSQFLPTHLHSTPPLGDLRRNIAIPFGVEKLEWCSYRLVKFLRICLFVSTESTNMTDTQTDTHVTA